MNKKLISKCCQSEVVPCKEYGFEYLCLQCRELCQVVPQPIQSEDPMYEEAKKIVIETGNPNPSFLQRRLCLGYAKVARLLNLLEERGIISECNGCKPREVLVKSQPIQKEEVKKTFVSPEDYEKIKPNVLEIKRKGKKHKW